jgi:predicted nucleotidyltransferase
MFQGILRADKTEKAYKISFSLLLSYLFYAYFNRYLDTMSSVICGFALGHTVNWCVNGNLSLLFVHILMIKRADPQNIFLYLFYLRNESIKCKWVKYAGVLGSISRGDLKPSSDVDVSIVRKPGLGNAMKAIVFSIKHKKIADAMGVPMELYISDSVRNSYERYKDENCPVILTEEPGLLDSYYAKVMSLEKAYELNQK